MLRFLLILVACLVLGMARGMAAMILVSDQELIGTSDLVIVGTVLDDRRVADGLAWPSGLATVHVDRVLKGQAAGNLVVMHQLPPEPEPGVIIMDHGGFTLEPQTQWLFFLQRYPGGYTIVGGTQGRRQLADEERFAVLIKVFPLRLSLTAPAGPIAFGQKFPMVITIVNIGDTKVTCHQAALEGFFYSPRFGPYLSFQPVFDPVIDPATDAGRIITGAPRFMPVTVDPKSEKTITVRFFTARPPSWQVFTPDTYLLTPVFMRAKLFMEVPASPEPNVPMQNYNIASPWVDALVGFPPPPGSWREGEKR